MDHWGDPLRLALGLLSRRDFFFFRGDQHSPFLKLKVLHPRNSLSPEQTRPPVSTASSQVFQQQGLAPRSSGSSLSPPGHLVRGLFQLIRLLASPSSAFCPASRPAGHTAWVSWASGKGEESCLALVRHSEQWLWNPKESCSSWPLPCTDSPTPLLLHSQCSP